MASKSLGYIISIAGIVVTALGVVPKLKEVAKIPSNISDLYIMGIGLVIVVLGIILLSKNSSSKQPAEVPIYEGKNVVGYRRMSKK